MYKRYPRRKSHWHHEDKAELFALWTRNEITINDAAVKYSRTPEQIRHVLKVHGYSVEEILP